MIIDFHSHILPSIDDGAADTEISLKMLRAEKNAGVDAVVATPHFYLSEQSVDSFIEKRNNAYNAVINEAKSAGIEIHTGAEVYFTHSLTDIDLKKLCIGNTKYMLIELPYQKLTGNFIRSFKSFAGSIFPDIRLILAHAERYLKFTDEDSLYEILDSDILVQLNCGSFKAFTPQMKFIKKLIASDGAHLIGTDCHNLTSRAPNMDTAQKFIEKKFSPDVFRYFMSNAEKILNGRQI